MGLESPTYVKTQNSMNEATIACENVTMNPRLTAMSGRTAQPTSMRHAEFDERTGISAPDDDRDIGVEMTPDPNDEYYSDYPQEIDRQKAGEWIRSREFPGMGSDPSSSGEGRPVF